MLEEVFAHAAEPKDAVLVEGAEHFFQGTKASPGAKLDRIQSELRAWLLRRFPEIES